MSIMQYPTRVCFPPGFSPRCSKRCSSTASTGFASWAKSAVRKMEWSSVQSPARVAPTRGCTDLVISTPSYFCPARAARMDASVSVSDGVQTPWRASFGSASMKMSSTRHTPTSTAWCPCAFAALSSRPCRPRCSWTRLPFSMVTATFVSRGTVFSQRRSRGTAWFK